MRERITEFTRDGKNFIYIDCSNLKNNIYFIEIGALLKKIIVTYKKHSVYTIINIENIIFDSETKEIAGDCLMYNDPYVKCGALLGVAGMKKIMANAAIKISGRKPMPFFYTMENAIEWLVQQK